MIAYDLEQLMVYIWHLLYNVVSVVVKSEEVNVFSKLLITFETVITNP